MSAVLETPNEDIWTKFVNDYKLSTIPDVISLLQSILTSPEDIMEIKSEEEREELIKSMKLEKLPHKLAMRRAIKEFTESLNKEKQQLSVDADSDNKNPSNIRKWFEQPCTYRYNFRVHTLDTCPCLQIVAYAVYTENEKELCLCRFSAVISDNSIPFTLGLAEKNEMNDQNAGPSKNLELFNRLCQKANENHKISEKLIKNVPNSLIGQKNNNERITELDFSLEVHILYSEQEEPFQIVLQPKTPTEWYCREIPIFTIGSRVCRGKDWKLDDVDGGPGCIGIVIGYDEFYKNERIWVYWEETNVISSCRTGLQHAIDIDMASHEYDEETKIQHNVNLSNTTIKCENCSKVTELKNLCKICKICKNCDEKYIPCVSPKLGTFNTRVPCISDCGCCLVKMKLGDAYSELERKCDDCSILLKMDDEVYHCLRPAIEHPYFGYDLCTSCGKAKEIDDRTQPTVWKPLVIAVIGCVGDGKSTFCNKILGIRQSDDSSFTVGHTNKACTKDSISKINRWMNRIDGDFIRVIDTPGLSDKETEDQEQVSNMIKFLRQISEGVNAFLFFIPAYDTRLKTSVYKALKALNDTFKTPRFWDHVIFIYSKSDPTSCSSWEFNIQAHEEGRREIIDDFKLDVSCIDAFYLSQHSSDRNYDKLLSCIKSKSSFTVDWLIQYRGWVFYKQIQFQIFQDRIRNQLKAVFGLSDDNTVSPTENQKPKTEQQQQHYQQKPTNEDSKPKSSICALM